MWRAQFFARAAFLLESRIHDAALKANLGLIKSQNGSHRIPPRFISTFRRWYRLPTMEVSSTNHATRESRPAGCGSFRTIDQAPAPAARLEHGRVRAPGPDDRELSQSAGAGVLPAEPHRGDQSGPRPRRRRRRSGPPRRRGTPATDARLSAAAAAGRLHPRGLTRCDT